MKAGEVERWKEGRNVRKKDMIRVATKIREEKKRGRKSGKTNKGKRIRVGDKVQGGGN